MTPTKVFIFVVALLGASVAEPPVSSSYLPPAARGSPSNQYGLPRDNGYSEESNEFRATATASPSYLPPVNNLNGASYTENGDFGTDGHGNQLSNALGAPFQDQTSSDFDSDAVTIDSAANFGASLARRPSSTYGVPSNGFERSSQKSGSGSSSFGVAPSAVYGAPRKSHPQEATTRLSSSPERSSNQVSNTYGPPFRSAPSGFRSSAMPSGHISARYGAPTTNFLRAGDQGFQTSSYSNQPSNRYTSAIPSNTYGTPFDRDSDNNFPGSSNVRENYSRDNGYSRQVSNEFSGYERKFPALEDPFAEPAKYEYNYEVQATEEHGTEFGHRENRENEFARGVYHVLLPDGRMQIVEYEADERGYRPQIRYEETGYPDARSGRNGY